jgi:hypothetical protein
MPGGGSSTEDDPAGFFMGIWHGWIAPISVIVGFFDESIRIYETYNTGWWYDFGFYIAIIGGFIWSETSVSLYKYKGQIKNLSYSCNNFPRISVFNCRNYEAYRN